MSYIYANMIDGSCGWLRICGWLWLWLRFCVWLWLELVRHCYTYRHAQSLDHTLIVGVQPPTLGLLLPRGGLQTLLQTLLPTPHTLYLDLQCCNASICGGACSTQALIKGAGVNKVRPP